MAPQAEVTIEQVRALQQSAATAREARTRAETNRDAAAARLQATLAEHGATSVEDLDAQARAAQDVANAKYAEAAAALGMTP